MRNMKIIISPAKKMQDATSDFEVQSRPQYMSKTQELFEWLQQLSYPQLKEIWHCSDKLAQLNYQRLKDLKLDQNLTPALVSYVGLQYSSMAPDLLEVEAVEYLAQNLRILSGLYGILAPFDGIIQYRLEMGSKLLDSQYRDLYNFWGADLYTALYETKEPVINLASKEYAKAIERYLTPADIFITVEFKEFDQKRQKYVQKATHAKQARGQFVRYLAQHQVKTLEQLKGFDELGHHFAAEVSTEKKYVFLKE